MSDLTLDTLIEVARESAVVLDKLCSMLDCDDTSELPAEIIAAARAARPCATFTIKAIDTRLSGTPSPDRVRAAFDERLAEPPRPNPRPRLFEFCTNLEELESELYAALGGDAWRGPEEDVTVSVGGREVLRITPALDVSAPFGNSAPAHDSVLVDGHVDSEGSTPAEVGALRSCMRLLLRAMASTSV